VYRVPGRDEKSVVGTVQRPRFQSSVQRWLERRSGEEAAPTENGGSKKAEKPLPTERVRPLSKRVSRRESWWHEHLSLEQRKERLVQGLKKRLAGKSILASSESLEDLERRFDEGVRACARKYGLATKKGKGLKGLAFARATGGKVYRDFMGRRVGTGPTAEPESALRDLARRREEGGWGLGRDLGNRMRGMAFRTPVAERTPEMKRALAAVLTGEDVWRDPEWIKEREKGRKKVVILPSGRLGPVKSSGENVEQTALPVAVMPMWCPTCGRNTKVCRMEH